MGFQRLNGSVLTRDGADNVSDERGMRRKWGEMDNKRELRSREMDKVVELREREV